MAIARDAGRSNFFHEALALTRRKLLVTSIERYHFQLRVQCVRILKLRQFSFFPIQISIELTKMRTGSVCTAPTHKVQIFAWRPIQWDELWYDFPVFTVNRYEEQAVSFEKVGLPESLLLLPIWWHRKPQTYNCIYGHYLLHISFSWDAVERNNGITLTNRKWNCFVITDIARVEP